VPDGLPRLQMPQLATHGVDDIVALRRHQRPKRATVTAMLRCAHESRGGSKGNLRNVSIEAQFRDAMRRASASSSPSLSSIGARTASSRRGCWPNATPMLRAATPTKFSRVHTSMLPSRLSSESALSQSACLATNLCAASPVSGMRRIACQPGSHLGRLLSRTRVPNIRVQELVEDASHDVHDRCAL
jgi:hypothetical protein